MRMPKKQQIKIPKKAADKKCQIQNNLAPVFLKLAQLECASDRKDEQP